MLTKPPSGEDTVQWRFLEEKDEQSGRRDAVEDDGVDEILDIVAMGKIRLAGGSGGHDRGGEALGNQAPHDRAIGGGADSSR